MSYEAAARSEDVTGPGYVRVSVGDEPVLLTRLRDGTAVAFGPICPHQNKPMDGGSVWEGELDCPHHHYTYDPHTGENRFPKRTSPGFRAAQLEGIAVYATTEADGWVWVGPRVDADADEGRGPSDA